jgi:predicted Zn-dependent protease
MTFLDNTGLTLFLASSLAVGSAFAFPQPVLLVLALEGPFFTYSPRLPLQSPTRPSATIRITDADEIRVGAALAGKFAVNRSIVPTPQSKSIEKYLQMVGERVAANAQRQLPYRFHYDPDPRFNSAVALPGGHIYVGAGILAYVDSEDELAGVLGHEVEHVALNHCRERLVQVLSDAHLTVGDAAKLKIEDFYKGYGHDRELAADREGVKLAISAGYNGSAGVRLLQMFMILAQQRPHTSTESEESIQERIVQMQSVAKMQQSSPAETPLGLR